MGPQTLFLCFVVAFLESQALDLVMLDENYGCPHPFMVLTLASERIWCLLPGWYTYWILLQKEHCSAD